MKDVTGYAHPDYAASLSEFGTPRLLPRSGGWVLERRIPGYQERDAIGCYPLFVCQYWSQLGADLDDHGGDLVSLALVTDPFGECDVTYLRRCFPDVVVPFKQHFVVDLSCPLDKIVNSHHRRNAVKALREVRVEVCANPLDFLFDWIGLYKTLTERRNIRGIATFSRDSFSKQLSVPGMVAFRAAQEDATVGMLLWYVQANRAYYHLGAFSARGYELRASFALFSYSIEYFARQGFEWLNLGAGAGAGTSAESGLNRFKQGWSTGVRTAYLCGRIFDQKKYREIVSEKNVPPTDYFPAYRTGEFN
jgi:hypothetical protein